MNATREDVLAVVVAPPGIVRDNGDIGLPSTFLDWSGFPLQPRIAAHFACPVVVENDAKLAALGEVSMAPGGPEANFVWVRADGVRIGVGIVIRSELYRAHDGAAGEIVWARLLGFESVQDHLFSGLVHPSHDGIAPGLEAIAWILAPHSIVIGGA